MPGLQNYPEMVCSHSPPNHNTMVLLYWPTTQNNQFITDILLLLTLGSHLLQITFDIT